jgi:hypothetical protein
MMTSNRRFKQYWSINDMSVIEKNTGFPVYALEWQDDSTIIAVGGGGIGNSGVKNKIVSPPILLLMNLGQDQTPRTW